MKKTLVIHPKDESTVFLSEIYIGKDWTIFTNPSPTKKEIKELIKSHDKIIMMGHGTPHGLLSTGGFMIDSTLVYLLREK